MKKKRERAGRARGPHLPTIRRRRAVDYIGLIIIITATAPAFLIFSFFFLNIFTLHIIVNTCTVEYVCARVL